jgi:hypothetical protein
MRLYVRLTPVEFPGVAERRSTFEFVGVEDELGRDPGPGSVGWSTVSGSADKYLGPFLTQEDVEAAMRASPEINSKTMSDRPPGPVVDLGQPRLAGDVRSQREAITEAVLGPAAELSGADLTDLQVLRAWCVSQRSQCTPLADFAIIAYEQVVGKIDEMLAARADQRVEIRRDDVSPLDEEDNDTEETA